MGPGTRTAWQHDARQQPDGTITFFDNGATPARAPAVARDRAGARPGEHDGDARAQLRAPEPARGRQPGQRAGARRTATGSSAGARAGYLSEFSPSGQLLFDAHLPPDWESYRTFALPWSGAAGRTAGAGGRARRADAAARPSTRAGTARPKSPPGGCSPGSSPSALAPVAHRAEDRLRDRDRAPARRCADLRGGAGARRRRRGHRRLGGGDRLAGVLPEPVRREARALRRFAGSSRSERRLRRRRGFRRGVPGGGEVVGEAARVGFGQARRQRLAQLLAEGALAVRPAAVPPARSAPALLCSSRRPLWVR